MKYQRDYYVPIVVKSRDFLLGFLDAFRGLSHMIDNDNFRMLDSRRLNEVLPDDSKRSEHSPEEIKEIIQEHKDSLNVKENEKDEPKEDDIYLSLNCTCGNYYEFVHPRQLPEKPLKCDLCERLLIDYTGFDDTYYEYNGNLDLMLVEYVRDDSEEDEEE